MPASSPRHHSFAQAHLGHHWRFYASILLGFVVFGLYVPAGEAQRVAAAGDAFFSAYLLASLVLLWRTETPQLKRRAAVEDEGGFIVLLLAIVIIGFCIVGLFTVLNQKHPAGAVGYATAIASAPLGWLTLHTIAGFHYANLYYFPGREDGGKREPPLDFPGTKEPGGWDFMYYSFVVGMTAQVSDVQVRSAGLRRVTLIHAVVSFFFNTVLIAMAVNAVVANAS